MKHLQVALLLLFILNLNKIKCDDTSKSSNENKKLCQASNKNDLIRIKEWWRNVSQQKPVKCQRRDDAVHQVDQRLWNIFDRHPIVVSRPCDANKVGLPFEIRGKGLRIVNGVLEGSGKLVILQKWPSGLSSFQRSETCIDVSPILLSNPNEIIGTFSHGYLEGTAKMKMDDGSVTIAEYRHGSVTGFRREWDARGQMTSVGYQHRNVFVGHCWSHLKGYLIYEDCSVFGRSSADPASDRALIVPLGNDINSDADKGRDNKESEVKNNLFDGLFNADWVDDLHDVSQLELSSADDCVLHVTFEQGKKLNRQQLYLSHNDDSFDEDSLLCQIKRDSVNDSPSQYIIDWLNKTDEDFARNPFSTLSRIKGPVDPVVPEKSNIFLPEVMLKPNEAGGIDSVVNVSLFGGDETPFIVVRLKLDSLKRLHGDNELLLTPGHSFGHIGNDSDFNCSAKYIRGRFVHGLLEGMVYIECTDNRLILARVEKGILNGPMMLQKINQILPRPGTRRETFLFHPGFGFIGMYKNGRPDGDFWIGMKGRGYLHGKASPVDGSITGDSIAYIYPDMETALIGRFENKFMRAARETKVMEIGCNKNGLLGLII